MTAPDAQAVKQPNFPYSRATWLMLCVAVALSILFHLSFLDAVVFGFLGRTCLDIVYKKPASVIVWQCIIGVLLFVFWGIVITQWDHLVGQ